MPPASISTIVASAASSGTTKANQTHYEGLSRPFSDSAQAQLQTQSDVRSPQILGGGNGQTTKDMVVHQIRACLVAVVLPHVSVVLKYKCEPEEVIASLF